MQLMMADMFLCGLALLFFCAMTHRWFAGLFKKIVKNYTLNGQKNSVKKHMKTVN